MARILQHNPDGSDDEYLDGKWMAWYNHGKQDSQEAAADALARSVARALKNGLYDRYPAIKALMAQTLRDERPDLLDSCASG